MSNTGLAIERSPDIPTRRRMRSDDRREQLLDRTADIVLEHGASALSMERLAVVAGVSKALPYRHFDNAEEALTALYRRETSGIGKAVWRALRNAPPDSDLVRVGVSAYFDEVVARAGVLAALSRPGSPVGVSADPGQAGVIFEVEVLERFHGLGRDRAKQIAGIVQGGVVGAAGTLHAGHGTRTQLEDDLVAVITALVRSAR